MTYTAYLKGFDEMANLFTSTNRKDVLDFAEKYRANFGGNVFVQLTPIVEIPSSWAEQTCPEIKL